MIRVAEEQGVLCGIPDLPYSSENRLSYLRSWKRTTSERTSELTPNLLGSQMEVRMF